MSRLSSSKIYQGYPVVSYSWFKAIVKNVSRLSISKHKPMGVSKLSGKKMYVKAI